MYKLKTKIYKCQLMLSGLYGFPWEFNSLVLGYVELHLESLVLTKHVSS